jgi:hypothetical protein
LIDPNSSHSPRRDAPAPRPPVSEFMLLLPAWSRDGFDVPSTVAPVSVNVVAVPDGA